MSPLNVETAGEIISAGTETFEASHIDVIETVIASLDQGGNAMVSRDDDGYLWKFIYGSVTVYVQLTGIGEEDTLTVWSPLLKLPVANQTDLMQELLALNCGETFEACFGISNQEVLVLASRILADINPGEISRLMTIVATIADEKDDTLKKKYPAA
ncbi:YbjN domain-containing protein [Leptothoe spongobia]|uniref:YbjN domain-containing protein n=1 Tax=Leptothoe spongobia TAU-MAC 1115 TaxID=1967444 RepID=A0A947DBN2_9CYAN|nr:YbjN domain-containing protein [Leptothoe spongobia]MBT9314221.1 YbjN domain-containing protein [Leptothoe spongobia TAU-MAC 1115]